MDAILVHINEFPPFKTPNHFVNKAAQFLQTRIRNTNMDDSATTLT